MRTIFFVVALSLGALGCGAHCDDSADRSDFISNCELGGSNGGYCSCTADYIFARYACDNFGSVTEADISGACQECAAANGESCNN